MEPLIDLNITLLVSQFVETHQVIAKLRAARAIATPVPFRSFSVSIITICRLRPYNANSH